jgi:hypothetical protein
VEFDLGGQRPVAAAALIKRAGQAGLRRARILVARSRKLSVPVSMMSALNVTQDGHDDVDTDPRTGRQNMDDQHALRIRGRNRHAGVALIVAPVMVRVRPLVRRQTDLLSTLGAAGTVVNQ